MLTSQRGNVKTLIKHFRDLFLDGPASKEELSTKSRLVTSYRLNDILYESAESK